MTLVLIDLCRRKTEFDSEKNFIGVIYIFLRKYRKSLS